MSRGKGKKKNLYLNKLSKWFGHSQLSMYPCVSILESLIVVQIPSLHHYNFYWKGCNGLGKWLALDPGQSPDGDGSVTSYVLLLSTMYTALSLIFFFFNVFFSYECVPVPSTGILAPWGKMLQKMGLFIYLWLCWVFASVRGLSPVAASGDHSWSRCAGLSLSRPLLLRSTGSRRAGSAIVAHGASRSTACGILPDQGSNPRPLHW